MMQLYPANAAEVLEFNKVCDLLQLKCRTDAARERVARIRFHTIREHMERELLQTSEFKTILHGSDSFPNDFTRNLQKELKLLSVTGGVLNGEQLLACLQLALNMRDILLWFKKQNDLFPNLNELSAKIVYEKKINDLITEVIDDSG